MPTWRLFKTREVHESTATEIYGRLVAQSRVPWFYSHLAVPDTPEGRLEMVMLHMMLMLRRLAGEGEKAQLLARGLTETFVTDMDDCMREMGVGDINVAKKVKKAAAALYDRSRDYGMALDVAGATGNAGGDAGRDAGGVASTETSRQSLQQVLIAHVLGPQSPLDAAERLAAYTRLAADALDGLHMDAIFAGQIALPTPGQPAGHDKDD